MSEARLQEAPTYKPGTFCWVELGTTDSAAAKNFYTQLFDWQFVDYPMGSEGVYTMFKLDGKDAAALYELMPEMRAQGIPPSWMSYVSVTNVDESAEKAKAAGGTLLKEPFDVFTVGRMAMVQDPTGAVFALWQAKDHQGAGVYNGPNSFCWNELGTNDPQKAGEFYTNLFGWTKQEFPAMEYTMFSNGDRTAGGMYKIPAEMGQIPPHWMVYFAVDDCDAKVQKATELGARVMKPADDIPDIGRFAILTDPQGAPFAVIKLDNPDPMI